MDDLEWHFLEHDSRARRRDPVTPELFHDEDLQGVAQALIRESIQNSLDARRDLTAPVVIRIFISGVEAAVDPATAMHYFGSLIPHLKSAYPEASSQVDAMVADPCEFLVIEDFGTTGLTGDIRQTRRPAIGESNNFFYFFRAEGVSGKSEGKRGRWGIGKHTYFASSRLHSFIGVTVRDDADSPGPLAMGQSISRVHTHPDDPTIEVEPDGWMARSDEKTWLPYDAGTETHRIISDWRLRRTSEPGLSVVVPYCDPGLSIDDLVSSVLQEYAHPVLAGSLEIEIENGSGTLSRITAQSIQSMADAYLSTTTELRRHRVLIQRMAEMLNCRDTEILQTPRITGNPKWIAGLLPQALCDDIVTRLDQTGSVFIRFPVELAHQSEPRRAQSSYFDVGLFAQQESARAVFIREGIRVTGVGSRSATFAGLMPIVIIPPGVLGTLLGDSEGPAHLSWDPRRQTFTGRYQYGASWIEFVRHSPRRLVEFSRGLNRNSDFTIGGEWFPDPSSGPGKKSRQRVTPPIPPPVPTAPKVVLLTKLAEGFSARLNPKSDEVSGVRKVRLVMAYDRRSGNPFTRWKPMDFTIADLTVDCHGGARSADLDARDGNQITIDVHDPETFRVDVCGFDQHRDVIVRAEYA